MPYKPNIAMRAISTLDNYANNARTHSESQVKQIADSIRAFGFVGAIIIRDGVIAKGHGTRAAANVMYDAGESIYPAPGESAGAVAFKANTLPVMDVSGWSDDQFRAYVVADNSIAENAGWDLGLLTLEIKAISVSELNVGLLAFSDKDMALFERMGASDGNAGNKGNRNLGENRFLLMVEFETELQLQAEFEALQKRGVTCKVLE